jgi:hypothetical protein
MRPTPSVLRRLAFATFDDWVKSHADLTATAGNGCITYARFVAYGQKYMQKQIHERAFATIKNWESDDKQDASPTPTSLRHRKMGNKQQPHFRWPKGLSGALPNAIEEVRSK